MVAGVGAGAAGAGMEAGAGTHGAGAGTAAGGAIRIVRLSMPLHLYTPGRITRASITRQLATARAPAHRRRIEQAGRWWLGRWLWRWQGGPVLPPCHGVRSREECDSKLGTAPEPHQRTHRRLSSPSPRPDRPGPLTQQPDERAGRTAPNEAGRSNRASCCNCENMAIKLNYRSVSGRRRGSTFSRRATNGRMIRYRDLSRRALLGSAVSAYRAACEWTAYCHCRSASWFDLFRCP